VNFQLHWDNDDAPDPVLFDQAPTGRYSTIKLDIGKADAEHGAISIEGAVRIDGDLKPFEIDSEGASFTAMVGCGETLDPGETAELHVAMNLPAILDGIDLAGIEPDGDGVRQIDDGDTAAMAQIVQKLTNAFALDTSGDN
jgi:hypothetical protein